jgi:hypothetical protein
MKAQIINVNTLLMTNPEKFVNSILPVIGSYYFDSGDTKTMMPFSSKRRKTRRYCKKSSIKYPKEVVSKVKTI